MTKYSRTIVLEVVLDVELEEGKDPDLLFDDNFLTSFTFDYELMTADVQVPHLEDDGYGKVTITDQSVTLLGTNPPLKPPEPTKQAMTKFEIAGKHQKLDKREIRALLHATATVMEYHGFTLDNRVFVDMVPPKHFAGRKNKKSKKGVAGTACQVSNTITIRNDYSWSSTATLIIHEMFHLYFKNEQDDSNEEKITSTLVTKMKPDIIKIANNLVENTQQRAAFLAHRKISYIPKGKDHYVYDYTRNHEDSRGKKYRKRTKSKKNARSQIFLDQAFKDLVEAN